MLLEEIAEKHGVSPEAIKSPSRLTEIVRARHELFYVLWKSGLTLSEIGRKYNRTPATVFHAISKAEVI